MPRNRAEGLTVPNHSERSVRNGSEPANDSSWKPAGGRPAVLSDAQLLELAHQLMSTLGRPPRLTELIQAAGGCQRQRASRAIQSLREAMGGRAVRSQLILPPILETQLRSWIDTWMDAAAQQLAQVQADLQQTHDEQQDKAAEMIQEQQHLLQNQRERLSDAERMLSELSAENQRLNLELGKLKAERDIALAVADERLRQLSAATIRANPDG